MVKEKIVKAIVQKIIKNGKHGPFVVATSEIISDGSITFSLERTVWKEEDWPVEGSVVYLSKVRKKRAGWRAKVGRFWKLSDEQRASKEQIMDKSWEDFVLEQKSKYFLAEDDELWKQWVDYKNRDVKGLISLLYSDVGDPFKRRALFILFVPSKEYNFIYCGDSIHVPYIHTDLSFLDKLNQELLDYTKNVIVHFKTMVEKHSFKMFDHEYCNLFRLYNRCILHLLTLLSKDKGREIWEFYSLVDIKLVNDHYHPFGSLLGVDSLDEYWKRKADVQMRNIILSKSGDKSAYAYVVISQLYNKLNYSAKFFAEQIQFILEMGKADKLDFYLLNFLKFLNDDHYKKLCHEVVRVIFLKTNKYYLSGEKDFQVVVHIREEFSDDLELIQKIEELEQQQKESLLNDKMQQEEAKEKEVKLLTAMK
jgi:hypothetical protein